ncbi:hypothetical protein ADL27_35030 [Streptomyces sp. NRRL F-6602]|nr:hypothetical protein ADL27_35030 [Streptomyces sp. NRRL F-6602]
MDADDRRTLADAADHRAGGLREPSSARVGAFYGALEQILGEHLSATQDQQVAPAASEEADAG